MRMWMREEVTDTSADAPAGNIFDEWTARSMNSFAFLIPEVISL